MQTSAKALKQQNTSAKPTTTMNKNNTHQPNTNEGTQKIKRKSLSIRTHSLAS